MSHLIVVTTSNFLNCLSFPCISVLDFQKGLFLPSLHFISHIVKSKSISLAGGKPMAGCPALLSAALAVDCCVTNHPKPSSKHLSSRAL